MTGRRITVLALTALFAAGSADARAASQVCAALAQKIQQSSEALEGRALSEALFDAAALDCADIASDMLARGASFRARNARGASALSMAAGKGSRDVIRILLAAGADLHHRDLDGATPILIASKNGRRRTVDLLLEAGADPDQGDDQGVTPLMAAAFNGDLRLLRVLLKAGVEIDAQDQTGKVALIYAAGRAFPEVVDALLQNGADADGVWGNDLTPLIWAAGHANDAPAADGIRTATLLLDAGAGLERKDNRGRTALMVAADRGHSEMVGLLLGRGADRTATDISGDTAASLAATNDIRAMLEF